MLLPALFPSWRFFDVIAASPRIEFTLLNVADDVSNGWQEFRPRPAKLSYATMLKRLFWNSRWNESLFLVSCAERIMMQPTEHSQQEIFSRIRADLERNSITTTYLKFRLVFISRDGDTLQKEILFVSPVYDWAGDKE